MGTDQMQTIGGWMLETLRAPEDTKVAERIRGQVRELCQQFPVPAAAIQEG
jgi:glycine hydroxymethyltransferase